jgi:WD40 repeat protein
MKTLINSFLAAALLLSPVGRADVAKPADEAAIRKLITDLGSDEFTRREQASKRLREIGGAALPLLRQAAKDATDTEVQARVAELIRAIGKAAFAQVRTFDAPPLKGDRRWLSRVAVTPDGKRAVTAGDECLTLWDVAAGKVVKTFGEQAKAYWALGQSGDGRRLIAGGDEGKVVVWDLETGKEIAKLTGHSNDVWGAALSADGKRAVTGGFDASLRLWDVDAGKPLRTFAGVEDKVRCLALSPDGKLVAAGHFADGKAAGVVRLWDVETGKEIRTLKGHTAEVAAVAFSPDGKTLLSGSFDGTVRLWETSSGKLLHTLKGHTGRVEAAAFADGGRLVISGGDEADGTVRVWEAASGVELSCSEPAETGFLGIAVLPDGRQVLTTGKDSRVRLWRRGK